MTDLAERIDRLESIEAIRDITARYPILLDQRDLEGLVQLFVEDVKAGPNSPRGRGPLLEHYQGLCRRWGFTVHQVFQQAIDFETPDKAMGTVYCKAEHQIGDKYVVAMLRYTDRYERRDGAWFFRWRQTPMWYVTDMLDKPVMTERVQWPWAEPTTAQLPDLWDSYRAFYDTSPH
ncbi:MAG: nuclear transport factor 2 family protein [Acidimicrobiia bacterium]